MILQKANTKAWLYSAHSLTHFKNSSKHLYALWDS